MFNVYSFGVFSADPRDYGKGLTLVGAESPEEAIRLLGHDHWQHPDNADRTVKVLEGVKSDRRGVLEEFFTYT